MSRKSFNPHDCIAALNTVKTAMQLEGKPFTKEKILTNLKNCGIPTSNEFWSAFRKSGLLQEVSRGQFMWMHQEPIFEGELAKIKAKCRELRNKYKKNIPKNTAASTLPTHEEAKNDLPENDPKAMTQFAIDFLKEQGYLIFAPTCIKYTQV